MEVENFDRIKGRGSQSNPQNKFLNNHIEYEPDDFLIEHEYLTHPRTQYLHENAKNIINEIESSDVGMMFSANPYQGCEHGCVYCYARNSHEYYGFSAGIDFETKIMAKINAPDLVEKKFNSKSWIPSTISLSGNTDCYQPAEKNFKLTRKILEVCLRYRNPVSIITKNALILRDIGLLSELASMQLTFVMISITTLDEDLRLKLEPRTVTAKQRLKIIDTLTKAGIPCGVMTAPIIPSLNNHEIPEIIKQSAEYGALVAGYTVVRLNGAIGQIFTDWIHKSFPDRAEKVINQIKECHGGQLNDSRFGTRMRGEGKIAENIRMMHHMARKKYMKDKTVPSLRTDLFIKSGQISLF
ncbi:MAG: PA0069 family radical SAM protein [Bacteroidota bacterium]|nr:PA0069 family radical SAM protein [Bacteroidota bacterium]